MIGPIDLWRSWRAFARGKKAGTKMQSKTKWGAVIAGIGAIAGLIGTAMSNGGPIPWGEILPQCLTVVGLVVAAIGARDAMTKVGK